MDSLMEEKSHEILNSVFNEEFLLELFSNFKRTKWEYIDILSPNNKSIARIQQNHSEHFGIQPPKYKYDCCDYPRPKNFYDFISLMQYLDIPLIWNQKFKFIEKFTASAIEKSIRIYRAEHIYKQLKRLYFCNETSYGKTISRSDRFGGQLSEARAILWGDKVLVPIKAMIAPFFHNQGFYATIWGKNGNYFTVEQNGHKFGNGYFGDPIEEHLFALIPNNYEDLYRFYASADRIYRDSQDYVGTFKQVHIFNQSTKKENSILSTKDWRHLPFGSIADAIVLQGSDCFRVTNMEIQHFNTKDFIQ